jgi:hypothetical protein
MLQNIALLTGGEAITEGIDKQLKDWMAARLLVTPARQRTATTAG